MTANYHVLTCLLKGSSTNFPVTLLGLYSGFCFFFLLDSSCFELKYEYCFWSFQTTRQWPAVLQSIIVKVRLRVYIVNG